MTQRLDWHAGLHPLHRGLSLLRPPASPDTRPPRSAAGPVAHPVPGCPNSLHGSQPGRLTCYRSWRCYPLQRSIISRKRKVPMTASPWSAPPGDLDPQLTRLQIPITMPQTIPTHWIDSKRQVVLQLPCRSHMPSTRRRIVRKLHQHRAPLSAPRSHLPMLTWANPVSGRLKDDHIDRPDERPDRCCPHLGGDVLNHEHPLDRNTKLQSSSERDPLDIDRGNPTPSRGHLTEKRPSERPRRPTPIDPSRPASLHTPWQQGVEYLRHGEDLLPRKEHRRHTANMFSKFCGKDHSSSIEHLFAVCNSKVAEIPFNVFQYISALPDDY